MERPERPSRHSKTHDKWKRIIEPAGDSDSSSDWSTENEIMLRNSFFENTNNNNNNNGDDAVPSTSAGGGSALADARDSLLSRVRMRSILPPHDLSSLLARYGSDRIKRPAPQGSDHGANDGVDPPSYHLLHHDYAERDADHNTFRDLQKYGMSARGRTNPGSDFSFFLQSNTPNGERKRARLLRHQLPNGIEPHEQRTNRTETEDSDRELYIIRLPSPSLNENAAATDENQRNDETNTEAEASRHIPERGRQPISDMKFKFFRRNGSSPNPPMVYPRNFFGDLAPLSERSAAAIAAARHDAASTSSAEVQVISMAGPSGSTTPPRAAERTTERTGPGDDEIIVIVEDQQSPGADTAQTQLPQPSGAEATATRPPPGPPPPVITAGASEDESLNQHLISLLECPVCTDYMAPPIHQCRRGHLLCAMCKPKLPQCPTCRSRFTDSRNLAMEQVADRLLYPCKNRELEAGCVAQLRLKDKPEHEANCEFRAYHCTLPMCSWKGLKDAVFAHSLAMHRDMLLLGSKQELLVNVADLNSTVYRNWLISAYDELFRVNFVSPKRGHTPSPGANHPQRQHVFGCVQFIGPRSGASRYKYTIETRRDDANRCLRYTRNTHSDLRRCMNIYSAVDCFHMRGEMAELVCERRDGSFLLPVLITLSLNAAPATVEN